MNKRVIISPGLCNLATLEVEVKPIMAANGDFHEVLPEPSTEAGMPVVAGISLGYRTAERETEKPSAASLDVATRPPVPPVNPFARELARISAEKGSKDRPVCFSLAMADRSRPKLLQKLPGHVKIIPIALTTAELLRKQCDLIQSQLDAEALAVEAHGGPDVLEALEHSFQPSELALIREAFYDLDSKGTGRVDRESFEEVLRKAGRHEEEISGTNELVRNADENGDGCLDWVEFLMLANRTLKGSRAGEDTEAGGRCGGKFTPSFGEFDFATSYSARLLSIFRLKPKIMVVPLMAGSSADETSEVATSDAVKGGVAVQLGSRDWWCAIDAVVEELAHPPPLKNVLPSVDDGAATAGATEKADFPALDPSDPRNLDLQQAQRHLTVTSEYRLGRLMLRALITQLRDSGTRSNSMSPRKADDGTNMEEGEGLPSAVLAALLKVELISAPKGAKMPLFDHEGTEYGELAQKGPPQLSAAFKFHGSRIAVQKAEAKRSTDLAENCNEFPLKILMARCTKANHLRGEPKPGEKVFAPETTTFDYRRAATVIASTRNNFATKEQEGGEQGLDLTDPLYDFGTFEPSIYDHVVAKEVPHNLGGSQWEGPPAEDDGQQAGNDGGGDEGSGSAEKRAKATAREMESSNAHAFVSKGGKRTRGPLFLHLGGAGVHVGEALWEDFGAQANATSVRGTMDVAGMPAASQDYMGGENPHGGAFDSFDSLFTHVGTGGGGFVPRAVFADVEPDACHRLQRYSACRGWISPEQVVTFGRETSGVYSKGYTKSEAWKLRNSIRIMLEHMDDACDGFVVTYAPSGGSGSSLASTVAAYLGDECSRNETLAFALGVDTSALASSNGPFGIYNSAIGLGNTTAEGRPGFKATITLSNEAMYGHPDWPASTLGRGCFAQCNYLIAGAIAASLSAVRCPTRCSNRDSPLSSVPEIAKYLHATLPGVAGGSLPFSSCIWSKPGLIGAVPNAALGGTGSALHGIPSPRPKLWTPLRPMKERVASISPGHLFADVGVCRCLLAISGFAAPYARPDLGGLPSEQPWFDVGNEPNFITGRVLIPTNKVQPKSLTA